MTFDKGQTGSPETLFRQSPLVHSMQAAELPTATDMAQLLEQFREFAHQVLSKNLRRFPNGEIQDCVHTKRLIADPSFENELIHAQMTLFREMFEQGLLPIVEGPRFRSPGQPSPFFSRNNFYCPRGTHFPRRFAEQLGFGFLIPNSAYTKYLPDGLNERIEAASQFKLS